MFKNATLYKITLPPSMMVSTFDLALAENQFQPCGATQQKSIGWVPPRGHVGGAMAEYIDGQIMLRLAIETKAVPGETVKRRTDELAKAIEQQTGRKPGKKQTKELKEQALQELLPMAFTKIKHVNVWINPEAGLLLIDSASGSITDDVVTAVIKICDGVKVSSIQTEMSPSAAMAHWLGTGEAPYGFTVDRECELKSSDEMKSVVRYGRHPLDTEEVRRHITEGKVPTRLAMTWRDRVSFVLDDCMRLKKIHFLDVVLEGATPSDKNEAFDADVAISTGEMCKLIPDLIDALGGEIEIEEGPAVAAHVDGVPTPAWHVETDGPDPLYDKAVAIVKEHNRASISLVQRVLVIGYNRAARLLEAMEKAGVVSHMNSEGHRTIL